MRYRIEFTSSARKQFKALPAQVLPRIDRAILALRDDPRPPGVVKMQGFEKLWRIRVGDYRVVYEIRDQILLVLVVRLGHRKDVYE